MRDLRSLRVHATLPGSRSNGPGLRWVLWTQGCTLACPGCFNPTTHSNNAGQILSITEIFQEIASVQADIEGITISGGEPLMQIRPLTRLLEKVRTKTSLGVVVFTGFEWGELQNMPGIAAFLVCTDALIAGRYLAERRLAHGLRGSSNKSIHLLSPRYTLQQFESVPEAELVIDADGSIRTSGIAPLTW